MDIGIVGLGRMGGNMPRRWLRGGHRVFGYARSASTLTDLQREGVTISAGLEDVVARLRPPRAVWVMLPAGQATEATIVRLATLLGAADVIVDGGNTFYQVDLRRAEVLKAR